MRKTFQIVFWIAFILANAYTQSTQTPYSGQDKREIKSLSPDEIRAFESGEGMGLAKVAELNHFPGPKPVIDHADELRLSDAQRLEARKIFDRMHADAVRLGNSLIAMERDLDRMFASKLVDSPRLRLAITEIARLNGELRNVHLQAHLEMRSLLTGEQIKKYDAIRGYDSGDSEHKDQKHER
jgi:LTXXQ motif family protein